MLGGVRRFAIRNYDRVPEATGETGLTRQEIVVPAELLLLQPREARIGLVEPPFPDVEEPELDRVIDDAAAAGGRACRGERAARVRGS